MKMEISCWPIRTCWELPACSWRSPTPRKQRANAQKWFIGCPVIPAFFSNWLWHSWLILFLLVQICSPPLCAPCPVLTYLRVSSEASPSGSSGAEPVGLGRQAPSSSCKGGCPVLGTPISYFCLSLPLFPLSPILSPLSISACTNRVKPVTPLNFLNCTIG